MSVNYNATVLNNRLQQVLNAIDAGPSGGFLRLLAGGSVVSSFLLPKPSAVLANDVLTFQGLSLLDPAAAGTGQVTFARVEDSTGTIVISGLTVAGVGSTADIVLSPTAFITAGQTIAITAATITGN